MKTRSLLLALILSIGLFSTSCSNDDNEGETLVPLEGKWDLSKTGTVVGGTEQLIDQFGELSFTKDKDGEVILATLSREKFDELTASEILILYEFASHVQTKLRIAPEEREVL
ncbi:MAG: hypothetical protein ABWY22_04855, partial [Flavobacterium sp.]